MTPVWQLGVGVGVGVLGGFLNTLAGGGSIVMVPTMMMMGLSASVANATSRVPIFAQCLASTIAFARARRLERGPALDVAPLPIVGALAGALAATVVPDRIYRPVLLTIMVAMALLMVVRTETLAPPPGAEPRRVMASPWLMVLMLAVGGFGGLIQAGAGFVLLAVFCGLLRYDLVRANALKAVVMLAYISVTVVVFAARGRIVWDVAAATAIGAAAGAWGAARLAVSRDAGWIRYLVIVLVVAMCGWIALR